MPHLMVKRNFAKVKKKKKTHRKKIHIKSGTHRTTFLYRRKKLRLGPLHLVTMFGIHRKENAIRGFYERLNERLEKSEKILKWYLTYRASFCEKKMWKSLTVLALEGFFQSKI